MKKEILSVAVIALALFSCNKPAENKDVLPADSTATETIVQDSAVVDNGKIVNKLSDSLSIAFDNAKNTAELDFNGEKATLKGDTVASGISYSNDVYKYVEHHGEITLTKNGKTVFSKKP